MNESIKKEYVDKEQFISTVQYQLEGDITGLAIDTKQVANLT